MARHAVSVAALVLAPLLGLPAPAASPDVHGPETVTVKSGSLELRAQVWRPSGSGPFPAIIFATAAPVPPTPRSRPTQRFWVVFLLDMDTCSSLFGRALACLRGRARPAAT